MQRISSPTQSCTATLTFSPTVVGPNPSLFSFNTDTQTFTTSLTGNGLGPVLTVTPSAITGATVIDLTPNSASPQSVTPQSLSPLALGTPSDPILNYKKLTSTSTITNSGTKPLTNLDLSYSASSTSSPYISSTCTSTLPAGASCTVSFSAYRHLKNKHTGFLSLSGNAIPTKQIPVSLDISTTPPTNSVISDTPSYDFGSVIVRQPSTPKRVTFSYFGDSTATLTTPSSSLLSLSNNTCENSTLSPGDTCSVDVALTPTSPRPNLFTLWMPSYRIASAGSSSTPISHQFNYSGLGESLSLNPSSLSTTSTTSSSSSATYTLSNTGNRASTVSLSHSPAATSLPFSLNASSSCSTIQPGTTCTITAVASANTEGVHTGSLTIDGSTSSLIVPSSLTVSDAPSLTLSSKSINFGTIVSGASVSPQSVVVANIGASAANLGTLSTTSPFTLSHNCPSSLPALSTCTLSFGIDTSIAAPSATAQLSSSLTLAASQPYFKTVALSATHQGFVVNNLGDLSLSPKSATFPYTPIGQQSYPKTFTITNANSAPFSLDITPTTIGADASQYTLSNNTCPSPLPANSSCTVDVSYSPSSSSSIGTHEATQLGLLYEGALTLTSDLLASDIPVNSLTFNPLNFNLTNPTTGSNVQYYYYKNTSANPLTFTPQLQIGSHFSILNNTCSSVQPNAFCKITVHAKTDTEGTFQDTLTANGTLVTLNSTVFPFPSLNFSQYGNTLTALDYGTVSHKKPLPLSVVQLNNGSTSPATLSPITFVSFSGISQSNDCSGTSNTTGTLCNFNINVSPSTIASPLNADSYKWSSTLNVSTADGLATTSLPIKGIAVVGTHSLPSSINFGTLNLGQTTTQPLTITNSSTNQAEISTTAVSPDASDITASTPCLNTWFAPGQTCVSTLTFAPTTPGIRTGTISLGIIGKSNQSRSVPWTASVLSSFSTEGILSPNSWAPNTTVGTPLTQVVTFTNTYYQPLTVGTPTLSSGFPAGVTTTSNTCSGQTVQPQATCTLTLQFASSSAFEKTTPTTLTLPLSPVNQSVSLTIPTAYASLGDPTITRITSGAYPDNYSYPGKANTIYGTGFAIGAQGTQVYVNDTLITDQAPTTGPFNNWRRYYSSGATATTQLQLSIATTAPVGTYNIRLHNIGSANDATATLNVASTTGALTLTQQALNPATGQEYATLTNGGYYIVYPPLSTTYQHNLTFTNTGGMPYTFPSTPTVAPYYPNGSPYVPSAVVNSNTCSSLTHLMPSQSCEVRTTLQSSTLSYSGLANFNFFAMQITGFTHSVGYPFYSKPHPGQQSAAITAVSITPVQGYAGETATASNLDFGTLVSGTPMTATITVKNASAFAPQILTPSTSGNSAFTIVSHTCPTTALAAGASCTITLTASSSTAQGNITGSLDIATSLNTPTSLPLAANSIDPLTSAGIDLTGMSNYFPLTEAPVSANTLRTDTYGSVRDTPPVIELLYYHPGVDVWHINQTPFNPSVPAHSSLLFTAGSSYSGFYNPTQALITGTETFSVSTWIKDWNASSKGGVIFSQTQPGTTEGGTGSTEGVFYVFKDASTGRICYKQGTGYSILNAEQVCTTATAPNTSWVHIAIIKDGTSLTFYINNVAETKTLTQNRSMGATQGFAIGMIKGPPFTGGNQHITDLAVFKRILTPAEISKIYSSKAPLVAK